ncbi:MAG: acyl-ACP--UDP-N-acetylglucosamine O-acyltransferase [Acidobacteria bacterium]|nr:acyl-ACP--UDP-N-acetylglucosamine O-acyltransferase [Acidobacteriota bacterium]
MPIHHSAIVDPQARVDGTAEIGPYCIIGPEVEIGPRTRLMAHVYVEGPTWIGADNLFYPFSSIGPASQDQKYQGERAETRIGNGNNIREYVTIHRGTAGGGALTSVGDGNLLMAYVHVAHDCRVGHSTVLANGVTLGGHVTVDDFARIGAFSGVHQFCRIGCHAMIGGYCVITQDVVPYSLCSSEREVKGYGANRVGLERRGFSPEAVQALHKAFRLLGSRELNTRQAIERIRAEVPPCGEIEQVIRFIESSERGVIK